MLTPPGNDNQMRIVVVDEGIGDIFAGSSEKAVVGEDIGNVFTSTMEIAMVDLKGTKASADGAKITTENVIRVAMEDLLEKDREEVEC
jgi:hypothetical protein